MYNLKGPIDGEPSFNNIGGLNKHCGAHKWFPLKRYYLAILKNKKRGPLSTLPIPGQNKDLGTTSRKF